MQCESPLLVIMEIASGSMSVIMKLLDGAWARPLSCMGDAWASRINGVSVASWPDKIAKKRGHKMSHKSEYPSDIERTSLLQLQRSIQPCQVSAKDPRRFTPR